MPVKKKREITTVVFPEGKDPRITKEKEELMALPVPDSNGGTERMMRGLFSRMPIELLEEFQIIPSRLPNELKKDKIRILWVHDLPGDPMYKPLENGGWQEINRFVFVSNWQMQGFMAYYGIPWSRCIVMRNAIKPIHIVEQDRNLKSTLETINLYYGSTPHRGLQILIPVFEKLCEKYNNIELYVHSSFGLYGWGARDEQYKNLIDKCKNNPKIHYEAPIDHDDLMNRLKSYHILAYPSIWLETSCLVLLEAMSAGLFCVHPNYGALYETSANLTNMYQFHENQNKHAGIFYHALSATIDGLMDKQSNIQPKLDLQKKFVDHFYNWDLRAFEWEVLLNSLIYDIEREQKEPEVHTVISTPSSEEQEYFKYKIF